jgi:hypothetical protein
VNKINNTWGENNSQLLPTHDDLMAKHIWYKYLQKPGKRFPPNMTHSGKSRLKLNTENRWLNEDYRTGDNEISERTINVRKSYGIIETGIDWKNKKIISQETGLGEEINRNLNYVDDADQFQELVNDEQISSRNDRNFKRKTENEPFDEMIIVDDEETDFYGKSPSRRKPKATKKSNKKSKYGRRTNSNSFRMSPKLSRKSSRNGSPRLSNKMSKSKKGTRFTSPSLPSQNIIISQEIITPKKSNLRKNTSKHEKLSREVTFDEQPTNKIMSSNEMLRDIERLKKKKNLTIDQRKLLAIYEQMS